MHEAIKRSSSYQIALIKQSTKIVEFELILQLDHQRQELYKWLEHTDPSDIHNRNRRNQEPETCEWLLTSQAWSDWLRCKSKPLWIHGIPGGGKTVLASFLFDKASKKKQENPKNVAAVYYYCYFGHSQDETDPFLR